jgi:Gpi18-like mannosyltransferase
MNHQKDNRERAGFILPFERKALEFAQQHFLLIAMIFVTLFSLLLRYMLRDYVSGDAYYYLQPWYNQMKDAGLAGLAQPVGNYSMLYQFFIALFTYLPVDALHTYKAFSVIFDVLLAFLAMWIVMENTDTHRRLKGFIAYAAVLLSPLVFLNSACWAQCDVIYTYFCVFSVYEMYKDKYLPSILLFGVALTFKLQAVFILPFLLFCYFYKKRFSFLYFLSVPVVMIALSLPGIVQGRSVAEVFTIYIEQTDTYRKMSMNYPSFWSLFQGARMDESYEAFSTMAIVLTVAVLLVFMVVWVKKRVRLSLINVLSMAFLLSYTCVLFLPAMHERYSFLYEILGLLIAFWYYRTIPILLVMYSTALCTYGGFLFGFSYNLSDLAFLNIAAYAAYAIYLSRQMFKDCEPDTPTVEDAAPEIPEEITVQEL